ncbi:Hypothetical predicted protein [Octopus vulgaris]|uniref:Uncharacterized protein n=1 Tax=Octopus vulgaris TaxID=6645 RepID=A0AA36AK45_OCTVU|nr:Hypothetical predicted protein [Octopus vulgaris]
MREFVAFTNRYKYSIFKAMRNSKYQIRKGVEFGKCIAVVSILSVYVLLEFDVPENVKYFRECLEGRELTIDSSHNLLLYAMQSKSFGNHRKPYFPTVTLASHTVF